MKTFSEIFEIEEPWPEGPGILTDIVLFLQGRGFMAVPEEGGTMRVMLPMPQRLSPIDGQPENLYYAIPARLRGIFAERWEMIGPSRQENVLACVRMYLEEDMTDEMVFRVNRDLADQENRFVASGEPPIWQIVAANMGLNPFDLPEPAGLALKRTVQ